MRTFGSGVSMAARLERRKIDRGVIDLAERQHRRRAERRENARQYAKESSFAHERRAYEMACKGYGIDYIVASAGVGRTLASLLVIGEES